MKVQFIGATHEVTGSCTLLEVNGRYYLVDCGMEQGTDVYENIPLPVAAKDVAAVFLTHYDNRIFPHVGVKESPGFGIWLSWARNSQQRPKIRSSSSW